MERAGYLIIYGLPEDYIYTNSNIMDLEAIRKHYKTWEGLRQKRWIGFQRRKNQSNLACAGSAF